MSSKLLGVSDHDFELNKTVIINHDIELIKSMNAEGVPQYKIGNIMHMSVATINEILNPVEEINEVLNPTPEKDAKEEGGSGRQPLTSMSGNSISAGALIEAERMKKRSISDVDLTNDKEGSNDEEPSAKKTKPTATTSSNAPKPKATTPATKKTPTPAPNEIVLKGELNDAVPVHESCQEIRRKMTAYLSKPGVTQASFVRELNAQSHTADTPMSAAVLKTFRSKKGGMAGNSSRAYYLGYVFFEKMRLREGKKKSKSREDMEAEWPRGVDLDRELVGGRIWCQAGERPSVDKFGKLHIGNRTY